MPEASPAVAREALCRQGPTGHDGFLDHANAPGLLAPSNLTSTQINMDQLRDLIDNLLYPELRSYGRKDRVRLLQEASKEPLNLLEWVGMLAALVLVVSFTRYSIAGLGLVDRLAIAIANFFVAVPLLVVTVGPLLVRRNKRGLQKRSQ
jgi:hypothetical protein